MSILIKFAVILDLCLELVMYLYECYRKHHLSKQSIDVIVRFNEEKRRKVYSRRYFNTAITSVSIAIVPIIALSFVLPEK